MSLTNALNLNPSPDNYTIMHELRMNQWYIYRSQDLAIHGLAVALEGYQNKVFVDIYNVHDTEGRYARLYEIVDSKPIADLDDALLEAEYPELFRALYNAIMSLFTMEKLEEYSHEEAIQRAVIFSEIFFSRLCETAADEQIATIPASSQSVAVRRASQWLSTVLSALYHEEVPHKRALFAYSFGRALIEAFTEDGLSSELFRIIDEFHIAKKIEASVLSSCQAENEQSDDIARLLCVALAWALEKKKS